MIRNPFVVGGLSVAVCVASASATLQVLASADFSTYANRALVGQNGWQQFRSSTRNALMVSDGKVTWAGNGNSSVDGQDAMLAFSNQITQPVSGTTVLNFDILLSISSAGSFPSFFAALNSTTDTNASGNFQNVRMVAAASGSGFVFGTRVSGQSGYPFGYGTTVLNFGQTYALRAEINLVAGNANDFIKLYVGNNFNSLSHYADAGYGAGLVTDISVGAMLLSQFASNSAFEAGVSVSSMRVTQIPAPGALALIGLAGLVARRRR